MQCKMLLLLMLLLVMVTCAAPPQQKRSLGPRLNETGRFYYDDESQPGHRLPCRFCPPEALTNSQYSYMQVPQCMDFYKNAGKPMIELISMTENENHLYALCSEGPIPGCGIAPFNHTNSTWVYGYGFGEKYSVYTWAELRCDLTNKIIARLYCNESLEWQTDFSDLNKCKAVGAVWDPGLAVVVGIPVGVVFAIAIVIVVCCCWRRLRRRKQPPSLAADDVSTPLNPSSTIGSHEQLHDSSGDGQFDVSTSGSHEPPQPHDSSRPGPLDVSTSGSHEPPQPHDSSRPGPLDVSVPHDSSSTSGSHEPPQPQGSSVAGPLERPEPSVKVFNRLTRDSLQDSCKIGDATFEVQEGSTFYIVAWAPPNMTIIRFHIVRSDGAAYRGSPPEELNLQNFHVITDARHEDDGVYTWTIQTETETYTNTLKIVIKRSADGRLPPVGAENEPYHSPSIHSAELNGTKTNEVLQQMGENVSADNQGPNRYVTLDPETFVHDDNIGERLDNDESVVNNLTASNIRTENNESVGNGNNLDSINRQLNDINTLNLQSLDSGIRPEPTGEHIHPENIEGQGDNDVSRVNSPGQIDVHGEISGYMHGVSGPMPVLANTLPGSIFDNENTDAKQRAPSSTVQSRPGGSGQSSNTAQQFDIRQDTTGCKTFIKAVNDVQFFERLSNLGDPNSGGKATCFHGLGEHYGMDIAFLRAIEWHRRGFVGDGPMKWVVDYLGNKDHKLGHLVWYFAQPLSARSDIVHHIVDDCRSHIGCQYCQRLKNSMLVP